MAIESMRDNPAGWYRDPDDRKWHRFWDGERWEEPLAGMLAAQRSVPEGTSGQFEQ